MAIIQDEPIILSSPSDPLYWRDAPSPLLGFQTEVGLTYIRLREKKKTQKNGFREKHSPGGGYKRSSPSLVT